MFGITSEVYSPYLGRPATVADMKAMTVETAERIYEDLLRKSGISRLEDEKLQDLLFDYCVNSGTSRAVKALQGIVGSPQDGILGPGTASKVREAGYAAVYKALLAQRTAFILRLCANAPDKYGKYKKGWLKRLSEFS
jgi:lysozyme family protein